MMSITPQRLKTYILLAIVSLFFTLWVSYIGEEAIYAISAYEMWYHHHYLINTIYGTFYGRPPLLNWLIIPVANGFGWEHVLSATRFISASATAFTALGAYWFVKRLVKNSHYALLCTAIYLTGDLLFYEGWIAYADPVLSLFIFFSVAFLWLGVEEQRNIFLLYGVICVSAGFLVKAISPYWFYGIAGGVLLVLHPNRKILYRPTSFAIHFLALCFPFIWSYYTDMRYLLMMWNEAINTAFSPALGGYVYQVLVTQPSMLLLRLSPISFIALFYYFKVVKDKSQTAFRHPTRIAFWLALINFLICWVAPRWPEGRYYMPVFPFMAMCMGYVVWNANVKAKRVVALLLPLILAMKGLCIGYFYYRYNYHEPDYQTAARDIVNAIGSAPLVADVHTIESSPVEKVAIGVNLLRYPKPPILATANVEQKMNLEYTHPTHKGCRGRYVIGQIPTARDRIVKQFAEGKRIVYLFCRR